MKRTMIIVLAIAISISMTACSALDSLLQVNIFSSFAGISSKDIAKASPEQLIQMSGSDSFYETLAGDLDLKGQVITTINDAMGDAEPSSLEYQELAVLGASVELQTTPAGELINNIGGILGNLIAGGDENGDLKTMMEGLLPPSVLDDGILNETEFTAMIDALVAANNYYMQLGAAIAGSPPSYAPGADVSAGDVAQSALVCAMIGGITVPAGYGSTGEYLYALLTDESGSVPESEFTMPDMENGPLGNIFTAAFGEGFSFSGE